MDRPMQMCEQEKHLSREHFIKRLEEEHFDILIIGGGATGAGISLDAATRGLKVALVEAQDFSFGTSSRSTKLVHGGVRYLENAVKRVDIQQYSLVRDALQERKRFLANAPHLAKPLPILTPIYTWFEVFYYLSGLKLYDLMSGKASLRSSEFLTREKAISRIPMIKRAGLKGAVLYYDGQFDDARMNVTLILTAIREGAVALNYVQVEGFLKENGKIVGAVVLDSDKTRSFKVTATVVVNATGAFADEIRKKDDNHATDIMRPSQGSHLLLPKSLSANNEGIIIQRRIDGRVLFLLPWLGKTLVGTTDHPEKITPMPSATDDEVEYILEHISHYLKFR